MKISKKELVEALVKGYKLTSDQMREPDLQYCIYDESKLNPFRFIWVQPDTTINAPMEMAWSFTDWREVDESVKPKESTKKQIRTKASEYLNKEPDDQLHQHQDNRQKDGTGDDSSVESGEDSGVPAKDQAVS